MPLWTVAQRFRLPPNLSCRPVAAGGGADDDDGLTDEEDGGGATDDDGGGADPPTYQTETVSGPPWNFTVLENLPWLVLPLVHW